MQTVTLLYGRNNLAVNLPDTAEIVKAPTVPGLPDEITALRDALRHPIDSLPLAQKVKPGDKAVIVHTDITRATPNDRILPVILEELEQAGVRRADISMLNALGTHRPQTRAELRAMLGDFVVDNYCCLQHDGHDDTNLVDLGVTSNGHPVRINRAYMDADVKILTGFIEPHFFAGFSAGPKGVLPSIAGAESVQSNHGYPMIGNPNATWGVTDGNPIWEEMREVALRTNPTFLLNVTLNSDRQITGVFAGDMMKAHAAGVAFVKANSMVRVPAPYDVIITTNGGYPLDQNLYQTIKGISAATNIIKPGGAIIAASACEDGLPNHGGFVGILRQGKTPQDLVDLIASPGFSAPDQWQVQIQAKIQLSNDVYIYSENLSDEDIQLAKFKPCRDIETLVQELLTRYGPDARLCAMPEGPQTVAYIA